MTGGDLLLVVDEMVGAVHGIERVSWRWSCQRRPRFADGSLASEVKGNGSRALVLGGFKGDGDGRSERRLLV